jgi:phosphoribosylformylglycinamidine synthase
MKYIYCMIHKYFKKQSKQINNKLFDDMGVKLILCYDCFLLESNLDQDVSKQQLSIVEDILQTKNTELHYVNDNHFQCEIGQNVNNKTAWSTNVENIFKHSGIDNVTVNRTNIYVIYYNAETWNDEKKTKCKNVISWIFSEYHDHVTEQIILHNENNEEEPEETTLIGEHDCSPEQIIPDDNPFKGLKKTECIKKLQELNEEYGLALDDETIHKYINKYSVEKNPMFIFFDLAQSDSEHCRHHFFNGNLVLNDKKLEASLFDMVKLPLEVIKRDKLGAGKKNVSTIAFSDNSSAIKGYTSNILFPDPLVIHGNKDKDGGGDVGSKYSISQRKYNYVLTAETHNFPTAIEPFSGASTGIGGRLRDVQGTGTGAVPVASSAGYCVGDIFFDSKIDPYMSDYGDYNGVRKGGEGYARQIKRKGVDKYPPNVYNPRDILIKASNGASDYGNKFGEPIIVGFTRSFKYINENNERIEWIKPIMFTSGIGIMNDIHTKKGEVTEGMLICKIGGPVYRIGIGGGSASSRVSSAGNAVVDTNAVQRADPEMEQRMNRVVRHCVNMESDNPIVSIHDQGAGGNGNVLKEIIEDKGANIDLGKLTMGNKNMSNIETWISEYQESNAIVIEEESKELVSQLCEREGVQLDIVGKIRDDDVLRITNGDEVIVDNYRFRGEKNEDGDDDDGKRTYYLHKNNVYELDRVNFTNVGTGGVKFKTLLHKVLNTPTVGSKRYLTNKVDRCVTGQIAGQQCVGPYFTPLNNYGLITSSMFPNNMGTFTGCVKAIGEQPIIGLVNPSAMAQKTFAEMLFNMVWCGIDNIRGIRCSANWMWPIPTKDSGEGYKMYHVMKELSALCIKSGIAIDGGKDSLSMATRVSSGDDGGEELVKSAGSLVLTGYAKCPDITKRTTPDLKPVSDSSILFIDLGENNCNMGGSIALHVLGKLTDDVPIIHNLEHIIETFNIIQRLVYANIILAGHDKSDGGLITCLLEMAIAGNIGINVDIVRMNSEIADIPYFFNEELGMCIQVENKNVNYVLDIFRDINVLVYKIGEVLVDRNEVRISRNNKNLYNGTLVDVRNEWEFTNYYLEKYQCNADCVKQEMIMLNGFSEPTYHVPDLMENHKYGFNKGIHRRFNVGIIRESGSNSDNEMASAFYHAGFNVYDINSYDLINGNNVLAKMHGLAFVGGFSFSDVLGSGRGWYSIIKNNKKVADQFKEFYDRDNTFSIGVCNGCQLMTLLKWVSGFQARQIKMEHNESGRYECRFTTLEVKKSKSLFFKGMEGLQFGMWIAHGEGKFTMPNSSYNYLAKDDMIPTYYIDNKGDPTEKYPYNPNGSIKGVASICSSNGRHLAIMPHPERSYLKYQIPWSPHGDKCQFMNGRHVDIDDDMNGKIYSPWFNIFTNAYKFLEGF